MPKKPKIVKLAFTDDEAGRARFELIHQGFLLDPRPTTGRDAMRRIFRVAEKLDSISEPKELDGTVLEIRKGDIARELVDGGGEIEVMLDELDVLVAGIEAVPWRRSVVSDALEAIEWLEASKEKKNPQGEKD